MNNPWWTIRDQMDDRTSSLLKKIKRRKKWSRHLNNKTDSKIQEVTNKQICGRLLVWEKIKNGVATQTRNTPKRCCWYVMKRCQNIESASSNERWEDEKMNVDETPGTEKLCPQQRRQKILLRGLTRQHSDRGLSLWSPIPPFKPVSRG